MPHRTRLRKHCAAAPIEHLEARRLLAIVYIAATKTLQITGTSAADTISLTFSSGMVANLNGSTQTFASGTVTTLLVDGSGGDDSITVSYLLPGIVSDSITGGAGNDTITAGGGDIDSLLNSDVSINGGGGSDLYVLDDTADGLNNDTYTFNTTSLLKGGTRTITFTPAALLTLYGSNQNSVYNIHADSMPMQINGGTGNEGFSIGNGKVDTDIPSLITIDGGGGINLITLNDQSDTTGNDEYHFFADSIDKGSGAKISYSNISEVFVTGSPVDSIYNVNSLGSNTSLQLNAGDNDDEFDLANAYNDTLDFDKLLHVDNTTGTASQLYSEDGFVLQNVANDFGFGDWGTTAAGYTGSPALFSNDGGGTIRLGQQDGDPFSISSIQLSELGANPISNANVTFVGTLLAGGTVSQTFTLDGTFGYQTFNFPASFTGLSKLEWVQEFPYHQFDNIVVSSGRHARELRDSISTNGGGGDDVVNYDDDLNFTNGTYIFVNGLFSSSFSPGGINYSSINSITLSGGSGTDTYDIRSSPSGTTALMIGGAAVDTFNIGGTGDESMDLLGAITLDGGAGSPDAVNFNDQNNSGAHVSYVVTDSSIKASNSAMVSFVNMEAITLNASNNDNTITVSSANAHTTINGDAGADTIAIDGGTLVAVDGGAGLDDVSVDSTSAGGSVQFITSQDLNSLHIFPGGFARMNSGGNKVLDTKSLTVDSNGTLDMTDDDLILDYTGSSPITTIVGLLKSGDAGGAWTGAGIDSSSAATNAGKKTALGYAEASDVIGAGGGTFDGITVDNTALLVKYTWYGDANLDGKVDVTDLGRFASNWQQSPRGWAAGNFNYDVGDIVDVTDLGLLATNWQAGVGNPLGPILSSGIFGPAPTPTISKPPARSAARA